MATEVLNDKTNCDTKETIRRTFYKNRIKKDNIKLELDEKSHQEERRKLLLEYQKKHRDEAFNAARGIFQELYFSELENMDVEEYPSESKYPQKYKKMNRMMLSEWMLDVPQDFSESWIMVPCPIGNRTRIVSRYGTTKAYSRKGVLCDTFPSALPGGNPDADMHQSAIVDCIWVKSQQVYYILDILYWSRLPFTNCEAEFRLYWINSKIRETTEFKERDTDINKYPILSLQNIDCNSDLSSALTHLDFEPNCIDGFLFYHRNAQYNFGCTPLVTWLKSFMLSEVLGIFVPSSLDEKPNDYINFEHYMENINAKKNDYKKRIVKNFMEIEYVA
ncbi:snurportin-1-like protein [Lasius niger]|uniref:Snurportin-1 n=1 Tax=Lasius niger TaxID=67767 RepID=A0A0J7N2A7_LASNI|nr:snurportin-1-like protein [Lasius niger]